MPPVSRPKVESVSPGDLVEYALQGRLRIPSIYQWDRADVTLLFDSILRGYPIGQLLVWQRPATAGTIFVGHLRIEAPAVGDAYWVVDGQQRITSLVGALTATDETVDPRFRIFFDLASESFVALSRLQRPADDQFPMSLVLDTTGTNAWLQARPELSDRQIALADQVIAGVRDYKIPMYIVAGDDDHTLRDIFQRTNTRGNPLTDVEVFGTLLSTDDEKQRGDLHTLGSAVHAFGFGEIPEPVLRQSLLAVGDPARTETALGHVVDFFRDEAGIPHAWLIPHPEYIPVLAIFMAEFGPPRGRAAELLRRWVWRGMVGEPVEDDTVFLRAVHTDPLASAQRLIGLLPALQGWRPDISETRLTHPKAKVNFLGLLSLAPRHLPMGGHRQGEPIDVAPLLEVTDPLVPVLDDSSSLGRGMANHLILPLAEAGDLAERLRWDTFDERVLASHCLDAQFLELLRFGPPHRFLEARAKAVEAVIYRYVQDRALFGFPDGPDVTALLGEDDERD
ncbi:DUF262 domain-containing protein [Spongiactinospora rosea]|uniref:DUF262 domain-containing protein n=1 Tax=Spongiactinospora rosea TaxID=2248750 RepID=A0A366M5Q4_9ACTN|nr:DUF262 domain-containing protein [Spongiactinospora rosea]RBQ21377.1 DUF262 domain-containing protein [Spongiactinospora rosea]